jgi:glycosyltransferase involved in cell wall biosynthesis
MLRILHIDTELTWRGGENQLRLLLEGLAREPGVECHVAVRPGSAAAARLAPLARVVEIPMRGGFSPRAALRLAAYCREHAIDVIDAHTSNGHGLALLAKLVAPAPRLVVHRRVDYAPGRSVANRLKYLTPKVDRFVAISDAIRRVLLDYGVPDARISVARSAVPPGPHAAFDRAGEKADLARAFSLDPSLPFFGNASALTEQKGHDVLLRAARRLKDRGVRFHGFIAGDGHLRDALERQRMDLGLEHDVTLLGFIEEVPRLLSAIDVLCVPSNFEGLGTILLDGAHAGACIVATAVGGIPEIVRHDATGLLSLVGDDAALAANLERALGDPALRARLAAAARAHVEAAFSVDAMVAGNLSVYRALTGAEPP